MPHFVPCLSDAEWCLRSDVMAASCLLAWALFAVPRPAAQHRCRGLNGGSSDYVACVAPIICSVFSVDVLLISCDDVLYMCCACAGCVLCMYWVCCPDHLGFDWLSTAPIMSCLRTSGCLPCPPGSRPRIHTRPHHQSTARSTMTVAVSVAVTEL